MREFSVAVSVRRRRRPWSTEPEAESSMAALGRAALFKRTESEEAPLGARAFGNMACGMVIFAA